MSTSYKISIYSDKKSIINSLKRLLRYVLEITENEVLIRVIEKTYNIYPEKSNIGIYVFPFDITRVYINDIFSIQSFVNKIIIMGTVNRESIKSTQSHGGNSLSSEAKDKWLNACLIANDLSEILKEIRKGV